jgi:hypothetical protein
MRLLLLVLLLGQAMTHVAAASPLQEVTVLRYVDQDAGDPSYLTRILVTPDFMRMDDGLDDGDFILLDRKQRRLINVMRSNNLAMVFTPGKVPAEPVGWKPKLTSHAAAKGTRRFTLVLNGVTCLEGVAAKHAAADAARAMAEMKAVLAATQYRMWRDSPADMQHDCDLANQVWAFESVLELGLPLEERDFRGRTRQFESEVRIPLDPVLFFVPKGMPLVDAPS